MLKVFQSQRGCQVSNSTQSFYMCCSFLWVIIMSQNILIGNNQMYTNDSLCSFVANTIVRITERIEDAKLTLHRSISLVQDLKRECLIMEGELSIKGGSFDKERSSIVAHILSQGKFSKLIDKHEQRKKKPIPPIRHYLGRTSFFILLKEKSRKLAEEMVRMEEVLAKITRATRQLSFFRDELAYQQAQVLNEKLLILKLQGTENRCGQAYKQLLQTISLEHLQEKRITKILNYCKVKSRMNNSLILSESQLRLSQSFWSKITQDNSQDHGVLVAKIKFFYEKDWVSCLQEECSNNLKSYFAFLQERMESNISYLDKEAEATQKILNLITCQVKQKSLEVELEFQLMQILNAGVEKRSQISKQKIEQSFRGQYFLLLEKCSIFNQEALEFEKEVHLAVISARYEQQCAHKAYRILQESIDCFERIVKNQELKIFLLATQHIPK